MSQCHWHHPSNWWCIPSDPFLDADDWGIVYYCYTIITSSYMEKWHFKRRPRCLSGSQNSVSRNILHPIHWKSIDPLYSLWCLSTKYFIDDKSACLMSRSPSMSWLLRSRTRANFAFFVQIPDFEKNSFEWVKSTVLALAVGFFCRFSHESILTSQCLSRKLKMIWS